MPPISLPESLRYFFSPFVIAFYYCIYDPCSAADLVTRFGTIPAIAFLVAGIPIYYLYRYLIYDLFVMPLNDFLRKGTQRNFIKKRYKIGASTKQANRILNELSSDDKYSAELKKRERPMRSGGIHLLYQAFLISLIFAALSFLYVSAKMGELFIVFAAAQFFPAISMDAAYDDEELIIIKSMLVRLDRAADRLGFQIK